MHLGGTSALAALEQRILSASGDVAMELNQIADLRTITAIEQRAGMHASFHLLADARVPVGGFEHRLRAASEQLGGRYVTYGATDLDWQHAKTFHFRTSTGRPETWLGNLAPIPKTHERTELSLVLGGNAAHAARAVTDATLDGPTGGQAVRDAIDGAARYGVLFNDPRAGRGTVSAAIAETLDAPPDSDLLVITKGIQHPRSTTAIIDAHRAGRDVRVFVRDIAREDAERLAEAGVDAWQVSGGLQPRVNAFFSGDRGVATTAFLWGNMIDDPARATSRDTGVLVDGLQGRRVRGTAMSTIRDMPSRVSIGDLVRRGGLPEQI